MFDLDDYSCFSTYLQSTRKIKTSTKDPELVESKFEPTKGQKIQAKTDLGEWEDVNFVVEYDGSYWCSGMIKNVLVPYSEIRDFGKKKELKNITLYGEICNGVLGD